MFVDTLPSLYYDMLIVSTFVGRIEDRIKKGRIVDIGASMREKKRIVLNEHVQAMSREERGGKRRSHTTREEPVKNHPCYQGMPKSPWSIFIRPKDSHRNTIKSLT